MPALPAHPAAPLRQKAVVSTIAALIAAAAVTNAAPAVFCNPLDLDYGWAGKQHRHSTDPVVVPFKNKYYLFATDDVPGYRVSDDLLTWKNILFTHEQRSLMSDNDIGTYCAPAAATDGKYYLQYATPGTVSHWYSDTVMEGISPTGPFKQMDYAPVSMKVGRFVGSAGHSSVFQDHHGNWWRATTLWIGVHDLFERRLGLHPVNFDKKGRMRTETALGQTRKLRHLRIECVSMPGGGSKNGFSPGHVSFACCHGSGMENHAKYGDSIYFHRGGSDLYVNLFISSELKWKDTGLTIRQNTRFPEEQGSTITISTPKPVRAALLIRKPFWAGKGFAITINGETIPTTPAATHNLPGRLAADTALPRAAGADLTEKDHDAEAQQGYNNKFNLIARPVAGLWQTFRTIHPCRILISGPCMSSNGRGVSECHRSLGGNALCRVALGPNGQRLYVLTRYGTFIWELVAQTLEPKEPEVLEVE